MTEWSFLLAPLAVFVVLLLFRFVGCDKLFGLDEIHVLPGYDSTVSTDTPVSYWRLQEKHSAEPPVPTVPNTSVSGGTAKDETGHNDGTYRTVNVQPALQFPDSPSAPGSLSLEAPRLLDLGGPDTTSLSVDGAYVEVPFSISLSVQSFSVEALVFPEWDPAESGLYRTVVTLCTVDLTSGSVKAFGFGIFAGPDPGAPPGPDVWQIWLADGTEFKPIKDPNRNLRSVDFTKTNYLAVTYDDTSKKLNMYVYVSGNDLDHGGVHPLSDVDVVAYSPVADPTQSLLIGMHRPPIGGAIPVYHPFKGRIQEVAIYSQALPSTRVISHILAGLNL
jgi:hypothetical protein